MLQTCRFRRWRANAGQREDGMAGERKSGKGETGMKKAFLILAAVSACAGAASAEPVQLAQYYEGGGYGGGPYRYCRTWAQGMVFMGAEAARKGCLQYGPMGLHTNFDAHFDWCMRTPPGRTQAAAARANALLASCNR